MLTQEGIFVVNNVSSKQPQASSVVAQWWALEKTLAKLPAMSINPPLQKIHTSVKAKHLLRKNLQIFHDILILLGSTCLNFTARNIKKKSADF
jgi:hypothetical protein